MLGRGMTPVVVLAVLLISGCRAGDAGLASGETAAVPPAASRAALLVDGPVQASSPVVQDGDIEPSAPNPIEPQPARGVAFGGAEVVAEGQNLRYEAAGPHFEVITTQEALNAFWHTFLDRGVPLPDVNFRDSFVLAGILGSRPTGGYQIGFAGLEQRGEEVYVLTQFDEPADEESVDMAFTQPYVVVRVDAAQLTSKGALVFVFETEAGEEVGRVTAMVD